MTEAEWLVCCSPRELLLYLGNKVSLRKQMLFAVVCRRLIWTWLEDYERSETVVWEQYADGLATSDDVVAAREAYGGEGSAVEPEWNPPWWVIHAA
jgi:hypothetical protein